MKFSAVLFATLASASALSGNVVARNAALDARSYSPGADAGYGKAPEAPASYDDSKKAPAPKASTSCTDDEAKPTPHPTPAPAYDHKPSSGKYDDDEVCEEYIETCTETVTVPKGGYHANVTAPAAPVYHAQGTGSPVEPTKAYYSNAANSMNGGAFVMGVGAFAALFM